MNKETGKHVEYLDLEEIDEKAKFFLFLSRASGKEVLSREERYARWLDRIDR
jgi:hypothetical protein